MVSRSMAKWYSATSSACPSIHSLGPINTANPQRAPWPSTNERWRAPWSRCGDAHTLSSIEIRSVPPLSGYCASTTTSVSPLAPLPASGPRVVDDCANRGWLAVGELCWSELSIDQPRREGRFRREEFGQEQVDIALADPRDRRQLADGHLFTHSSTSEVSGGRSVGVAALAGGERAADLLLQLVVQVVGEVQDADDRLVDAAPVERVDV